MARIPVDELRFTYSRSGGPGGQHVNRVETRVTLLFDVDDSVRLSDEEKRVVRRRLTTRINKEGAMRVVSQRHRSREANRRAAIERFDELLEEALRPRTPRRKTRVPAATRRRRLTDKRRRGELKRRRRDSGDD